MKPQPKLCRKSKELAKSTVQGTFLQRVAKNAVRKEHEALRAKSSRSKDPECTFKPRINDDAKARRPRSALEMSRGDSLKRETTARLMKLKAEQDELAGLTFKPDINATRSEGRLRILSEPETYIQRLQKESKMFSDRQRRAVQEQEMKEFAECTFRPEVHEAPAYVKRIAHSMALTRAAHQAPALDGEDRPEWR